MSEDNLPETIAIVKNDKGVLTVTSLEVAKRFDRRHADVMQSIYRIRNQEVSTERHFSFSEYLDKSGRPLTFCIMDRDGFSILAMGFTGSIALKWKVSFIEAFNAMEQELTRRQEPAVLSRMEILQMAMDSERRAIAAEAEVGELKPDAEGMRMLRSAEGTMTLTQVAKMLEVKRPWLFDLLTEAGWLYSQNGVHQPYAPLMKQGMLTVDPRKGKPIMRTSGAVEVKVTTLVTAKGLAKITKIVKAALEKEANAEHEEEQAMMDRLNHDDRIYGSGD
jgi:anti-repressor protein